MLHVGEEVSLRVFVAETCKVGKLRVAGVRPDKPGEGVDRLTSGEVLIGTQALLHCDNQRREDEETECVFIC